MTLKSIMVCLLVVGVPAVGSPFSVPKYVTSVPDAHYAGVSAPMQTLAEARKSAIYDVVRQVLGSIDTRYDHRFVSRMSGDPRKPDRTFSDSLQGESRGMVLHVERNIVHSSWQRGDDGRYVYFILVRYPDTLIAEMRRLTKGPSVHAALIRQDSGFVELRLSEVNGVAVTFASAEIHVRKRNRYAGAISFILYPVSKGSSWSGTVGFDPVTVKGGSRILRLDLSRFQKGISDYLLGAEVVYKIVLRGYDELSRPASVNVAF